MLAIKQIVLAIALLFIPCVYFGLVEEGYSIISHSKVYSDELKGHGTPPVLPEAIRDSSWTIRDWIAGDDMHGDCKTAHEMMDKGVLQETRRVKGRSYTKDIFKFIASCKNASQFALKLVKPKIAKWCAYRATDNRLEELCREWEEHGESYLSKLDDDYVLTVERFKAITNDYYNDRL